MKGGLIKHIVQISFVVILIFSVTQIKPFGTIVENASAGSSWVQTTYEDFNSGTRENLTINVSGTDAKVELKKDYEIEYTVDGNTVALWHFNEGSGSTAYDETSNYNNGTINGANWALGNFGDALDFDGVDDFLEVADDPSLDITDAITLEAWCKRGSTDTYDYIIEKGGGGLSTAYTLSIQDTNLARIKLRNSSVNSISVDSVSTIDAGKWYNIAGTYDGSNIRLYVNGVLENTVSWDYGININSDPIHIGEAEWSSNYNFDGVIDEVRILDVARAPVILHKGTFTSSICDTDSSSNFNTIQWNPTSQPPNTNLKFQVATNNDASTWNFVGPDGTSSTYYTASGQAIWSGHKGDRYLRYKAYLNTTDYSVIPSFQDVTIDYNCLPATPSLLDPPNNELTNDNTPNFSWVFSDLDGTQSGFQVLIDDDSGFSGIDYNSGEQSSSDKYWQFPEGTSYTVIADGTWYWKVRTQDNDDDWGPYSDHRNITIDTTPPNIFTPTADPSGWTTNTQPIINFFTTDATTDIDYYNLSIDLGTFSTQESPFNLPTQTDGVHNITVRAYDMVGNYIDGFVDVYIDTTPPNIFTPTADPSGWTTNTQPVIYFSTTDAASGIDHYELKIDSGVFSTRTSPFTLPFQTDGIHHITVRAYDKAGNYIDGFVDVYIDTIYPTVTSITLSDPPPTKAGTVTFTITFSDEMNTTVSPTVTFGKISPYNTHTTTQSSYSGDTWTGTFVIGTTTGDGTYTIGVSGAEDLAGNQMVLDASYTFIIDTAPPTVKSITLSDQSPTKAGTVTFTIIFSEDMSTTVSPVVTFGKQSPYDTYKITQSSYSDDTWTGTFVIGTTTGDGTNTISVSGAEDLAGNQMVLNASYTFIIDTAHPTVTDKTPTGTGASLTTTISITFDEAMNKISVENAFGYTDEITVWTAADGSISWDANTMIFTPGSDLSYGTEYSVAIGTEAEDLAGNGLASPCTWSFTTLLESDTTKIESEEEFPLMWLITIPLAIIGILVFLYLGKGKDKSHELKPKTLETEVKLGFFSAKKKFDYKEAKEEEPKEEVKEKEEWEKDKEEALEEAEEEKLEGAEEEIKEGEEIEPEEEIEEEE